jgi:hypothetical protein
MTTTVTEPFSIANISIANINSTYPAHTLSRITNRHFLMDPLNRQTHPHPHLPSFDPPDEPGNLQQALSGPDAHLWLAANNREMKSQFKNDVFTIVPRPKDHNVVSTKFVFRIRDSETAAPLYKSRWVLARGFTQIPGQGYDDTFAPVPKATTIGLPFSYAGRNQLYVYHFDVETAKTEIDKTIYAEQPAGYEDPEHPAKDWVLLLNKGL